MSKNNNEFKINRLGTMKRQQNRLRPELVFWFDAPPRAGAGAFRHVAQEWGNKVFYLCAAPLSPERRAAGWKDCDHGNALITILADQADPHGFVRDFIHEHSGAIHVCNGFRSSTAPYFKRWLFPVRGAKIALWSERPNVYGNKLEKMMRNHLLSFIYRYYALRFQRKIAVFFPLGTLGMAVYASYGWERRKLFPFMYVPQVSVHLPDSKTEPLAAPLRFLYVGRFAKSTKGIDVLVHAIDGITGENWSLDLVGGYGDMKDWTISWAEKHSKVCFLGTWPSKEICQRMTQYDACIIPSRYDGWNVVVNEAIHAGIGVIVSDAAVSDELVKASGAGVVVPAGDVNALRDAIQRVIDTPTLVDIWKEKARAYSKRISSEYVGNYFMQVLDYSFLDPSLDKPQCPWL